MPPTLLDDREDIAADLGLVDLNLGGKRAHGQSVIQSQHLDHAPFHQ